MEELEEGVDLLILGVQIQEEGARVVQVEQVHHILVHLMEPQGSLVAAVQIVAIMIMMVEPQVQVQPAVLVLVVLEDMEEVLVLALTIAVQMVTQEWMV
jgi:hypothetical protein